MPVPMCADDAADAVDAEHVERVVIAKRILERRAGEEADRADDEAQHDRAQRSGEAGGRRDHDQAGNRARRHAEQARLAAEHGFGKTPRDRGSSCCNERVDEGEDRHNRSLRSWRLLDLALELVRPVAKRLEKA